MHKMAIRNQEDKGNILFFCNPRQSGLLPSSITSIENQHFFNGEKEGLIKKLNLAEGIIILLELNWDNLYFSDLKGFSLIYQLRVEFGVKTPIIVTSNYPQLSHNGLAFHHHFHKDGFRYFRDASISFISLPELIKKEEQEILNAFESPIEDELLQLDIIENLYKKEGYLLSFFNDLSNYIRTIVPPISGITFWNSIKGKIHQLNNLIVELDIEKVAKNRFIEAFNVQNTALNTRDINRFFISFKNDIIQYYEQKNQSFGPFPPEPIKALYISNANNNDIDIKQRLADYGIACQVALSSSEALEILKNDKIRILISDFRFLDPNGQISREQGYHIINKIYKVLPNLYFSIVLSNLDISAINYFYDHTVNQIYLNRDEILRSRILFSRFAQTIFNKDEEVRKQIALLPDFGNALPMYLKHISQNDFEKIEDQIDDFALHFIKNIIDDKPQKPLNNPGGSFEGKDEENNMINFRTKLKARRIALGIVQLPPSFLSDYDGKEELWYIIYSCLLTGQISKRVKGSFKPFISRHLFKMKTNINYDWHRVDELRLTPREKNWLLTYGQFLERGIIPEEKEKKNEDQKNS